MLLLTTLRQGRQYWGGLGVLLALLPLRGWAEAAMHLSAPAPLSAAGEVSMPPCHAAMAERDGATPEASASGCSLCPLCHGSALGLGESGIAHDAGAAIAPAAAPQGHGPPCRCPSAHPGPDDAPRPPAVGHVPTPV